MADREKTVYLYDNYMKMPERCREVFISVVVHIHIDWVRFFEYHKFEDFCLDSPIESIMYMVLTMMNYQKYYQYKIHRQKKIVFENTIYRVDFYVEDKKTGACVIVECDGHDFHEKTKEQVNYGNQRDYDLKMLGYDVLHFTGSRIYNNPVSCALDVFKFIDSKGGCRSERC